MMTMATSKLQGEWCKEGDFNPSRIQLARRRRGYSQIALASDVGVDRRSVVAYEAGTQVPSEETLKTMSVVLDFPQEFFFGPDLDVPQPDAVSFRAMSKMTAAQRDMAIGQGALALCLCNWIEDRFNLPSPSLPDLSAESDPESAAIALRYAWGKGEAPIDNLLRLMESKGIRVFSLSIESREVDAFSMWKDSLPLVFLNTQKSAERSRFDAAHELGHLVMHRHALPHKREAEQQANAFASAFLMPQKSVIAHAPRIPSLAALIKLKHEWKVSVASLTYRLHDLGLINKWTYRNLYQELNRRGYTTHEPETGTRETSTTLTKVMSALREDGITKGQLAAMLALSPRELDQLMFGLVVTSLKGGVVTKAGTSTHSAKPSLKIIK